MCTSSIPNNNIPRFLSKCDSTIHPKNTQVTLMMRCEEIMKNGSVLGVRGDLRQGLVPGYLFLELLEEL